MDGVYREEPTEPKRLPEASAQQCRRTAEDLLGLSDADVPRAIAWGLLAVAAELHEIRKQQRSRR